MLLYKLLQKANPQDRTKPSKWYASPVNRGRKTISQISEDISNSSSLSRGDIQNVILSIVDQIPKYLSDGQSVELGELGTLRLSFSSQGVDSKDDFNTNKINGVKIIFTPSVRLKEKLSNLHFEIEN
jgi:predicted histone-like DNA-binding protein